MLLEHKMIAASVAAAATLVVASASFAQTASQAPPPKAHVVTTPGQASPPPGAGTANQPGNAGRERGRGAGVMAGLNLTQAQRDELRTFREAQRKDTEALREKMRTARQGLREAMRADVPDEAAVRSAASAVAALEVDRAALRARAKGQFMGVLTPEQQALVKEARARAAERARRVRMRASRMMRQEFNNWWWNGM
jgi:periplasmic protein CpxP/Spy